MSVLDVAHEIDSPAVISDEVGGEVLAINLNSGAYFVIPPSAQPVWLVVSAGVAGRQLLESHDDPRADALATFIDGLLSAGLLRVAAEPRGIDVVPGWSADGLAFQEHTDMADLLGLDPIHDADENVGWPTARPAGE